MSTSSPLRVLVCFDGSQGSTQAVEAAGRLFPGATALIVHVWRPPMPYGGVTYGGQIILPPDIQQELELGSQATAEEVAGHGAELAKHAGLQAEPRAHETTGPVWRSLLELADEYDVDAIVAGSRGFREFKAMLLGSTSSALAHHSHRPLVIVPPTGPAG